MVFGPRQCRTGGFSYVGQRVCVVAVSRGDGQARAQARVDALIAIGYSI
jgi:hypothetical protein